MTEYQVNRESWQQLDIMNQMGNIGADVGRTITAWRNGQSERFEAALNRTLDLFDATVQDLATRQSPRLREVCRAREEFLGLFFVEDFENKADTIERYFMQYATAARQRHLSTAPA